MKVKAHIGKHSYEIEVIGDLTVGNFKKELSNKSGVPINKLELYFGLDKLQDSRTMISYGIKSNADIINIYPPFKVTIVTERQQSLTVCSDMTIENFKKLINIKIGIDIGKLHLYYNSEHLDDNKKLLNDYKIVENSLIHVTAALRGGI